MQTKDDAPQWAVLAALRFLLAATVALGHFALFVRPIPLFGDAYLNPGSAVFGFFILSGFSISASLKRETKGFYKRRLARIAPLYLATIIVGVALNVWLPNGFELPMRGSVPHASITSIIASLLMLQTVIAMPLPMVGQIWSLSAEWWHYMIAPSMKNLSNFWLFIWIALSLYAYLNITPPPGHGTEGLTHGMAFVTLSWLWVTGFLYFRIGPTPPGFCLLAIPSTFVLTLGGFTGPPLFISIFVLVLSSQIKLNERAIKICNYLGDLSFPLYLFHFPALILALRLGSNRSIITLAAMLIASIAALHLIDYPARKLFRREKKKREDTIPIQFE